jgi:penicillin-binding protein 1A
MPDNYDNKNVGPINLRDALAQSRNVPAVELFYLSGLPDSLKTAEDMGISTLSDIGRYGLTLVIGGGEVTLLDITSAYGVFANNGNRNPYTGILKVEDSSGKVLEEFTQKNQEVLPKNTALTISNILSDEKARVPTFGSHSVLYIPGKDIAVKTGTTNNNKDAWTIGYTPSIVVGVWAGNNDNTPMKKGGATVAGPIWNKFMNEALNVVPDDVFEKPNLDYDPLIKPILKGVWQPASDSDLLHSILYYINKNDITGPGPINPSNDSQFNHFEIPVQKWWSQNKSKYSSPLILNTKP